ncbi:protein FAM133-like [Uranotaenia lowii]|uniref:protein FAM133-like n=1 Tax=Uranotaenia lowii TaxID=190385 RepID=UPI00247AD990|nr:protein FAM133-like [Uranotaenia lowii]XP_055606191.1 protein FAM133-like [Uranotaenia lowii]XP_055606192.1 protein FAM133-like [Uranotaenia lowii]XP_055606193.1 protein FAM133-like [Uranotaenia lowii]XP_055606194.1 protein FAM133-like [Uranotaenia lowii]
MNLLVISFLALASLSSLPVPAIGTPAAADVSDPKKSVAAAEAAQPVNDNLLKEIWQEDDREVLIRNERGTKNGGAGSSAGKKDRKKNDKKENSKSQSQPSSSSSSSPSSDSLQKLKHQNTKSKSDRQQQQQGQNSQCRYTKGPWTECDNKSNTRSRTLTLKKGEQSCVPTRTIQKKCKKACRYDKGAWSECGPTGQMSRSDSLKSSSDATCQPTRVVNKNCNQGKSKDKQNKPAKAEKKEKGLRKNRQ